MELCSGGDLLDYLSSRNYKIGEDRAKTLVKEISSAIFYLHSFGIVHRDLKPENIMMTKNSNDSVSKLIDFGLSKIIGPNVKCSEKCGTIYYVSPEILLGESYDKRTDLWSLGIISYILLSGCLP